jgi:hypothetical protein
MKTSEARAGFKTISVAHGCAALTQYLHSMSLLDRKYEVIGITKAPGALDLKIEIQKEGKDD